MLFTSTGEGPERRRCLAGDGSPVLGDRLANLRTQAGITQQELAERIAISRVALSNLESGRSIPGERTVALLAGVFGMEPHQLVGGTNYPAGKTDRLPMTTNRYTEVQLQISLMERDLMWLDGAAPGRVERVLDEWRSSLLALKAATGDPREVQSLVEALAEIERIRSGR